MVIKFIFSLVGCFLVASCVIAFIGLLQMAAGLPVNLDGAPAAFLTASFCAMLMTYLAGDVE